MSPLASQEARWFPSFTSAFQPSGFYLYAIERHRSSWLLRPVACCRTRSVASDRSWFDFSFHLVFEALLSLAPIQIVKQVSFATLIAFHLTSYLIRNVPLVCLLNTSSLRKTTTYNLVTRYRRDAYCVVSSQYCRQSCFQKAVSADSPLSQHKHLQFTLTLIVSSPVVPYIPINHHG